MISFFIVWVIRICDTKKFVIIKIDFKTLIITLIIIFIQIATLYMKSKYYFIIELLLVIIIIFVNKSTLFDIINGALEFIKNKKVR